MSIAILNIPTVEHPKLQLYHFNWIMSWVELNTMMDDKNGQSGESRV